MKLQLNLILALLASLGTQSTWALEPVNTTNVKIVNPALIKRDALELDEEDFSPAQKLKIQNVMQDMGTQVKNAFKGEEALQAEMSGELKKISALKDNAARSSAIKAYQAKYGKRYQAILAKGNINLNTFASRLNADLPDMQFNVTNSLSIKGLSKTMQAQSPPNAQAQSSSGVREIALGMNDFLDNVDNKGCDSTFQYRDVNALGASTLISDSCEVLIERSARVAVPKRTKMTMTITADLKTYVFARSNMYGYALAKIPVASGPKIEAKSSLSVPWNWVDDASDEAFNQQKIKTYTNNSNSEEIIERKVAKLKAKKSFGIDGHGYSDSSLRKMSVIVKFEPI
jgi:hypothetical protein